MLFCSCVFSVLSVLRLPRLGKRDLILVLSVCLFDFRLFWFCLFPLPLGVWEGLRLVIGALPGLFSYLFCAPSEDSDQPGYTPSLSESLLCVQWVANDPNFLHADSEDYDQTGRMLRLISASAQSDHIRRLAHMPFCWFCHALTRLII